METITRQLIIFYNYLFVFHFSLCQAFAINLLLLLSFTDHLSAYAQHQGRMIIIIIKTHFESVSRVEMDRFN